MDLFEAPIRIKKVRSGVVARQCEVSMLYEVEYDLQWGSRGNRAVIFYLTDKKPTTKQIVDKLKQQGIAHPNTRAITIKEMPLEVMHKRENGRNY